MPYPPVIVERGKERTHLWGDDHFQTAPTMSGVACWKQIGDIVY